MAKTPKAKTPKAAPADNLDPNAPAAEVVAEVSESETTDDSGSEGVELEDPVEEPKGPPPRRIDVTLAVMDGLLPGYCARRLDCTLSPRQAQALRALQAGFAAAGAKIHEGAKVETAADAIKCLLDGIAANLEAQPEGPA